MSPEPLPDEALVFEDISRWNLGIVEFMGMTDDDYLSGGLCTYPGELRCRRSWDGQVGIWRVNQLKALTPAAADLLANAQAWTHS